MTPAFGLVSSTFYVVIVTNLIRISICAVTGTSSGLGRTLVEEVLAAGERVAATTRNASALASLASAHSPEQLLVVQLDISSIDQIKATFQQIKSHFGRLDVVVNNAGYGLCGEVEATSDEQARYQMEVNFWGPVRMSREVCSSFILYEIYSLMRNNRQYASSERIILPMWVVTS